MNKTNTALDLAQIAADDDNDNDVDDDSPIKKLFEADKKIKSYFSQGSYDDAIKVAKWRYEQDSNLHKAPVLVQYYVTLVRGEAPLKAGEIKDELIAILNAIKTSGKELEQYASKLRKNDKPFEAILFYQLAIHYCQEEEEDVSDAVNILLQCCIGTAGIVDKAIKQSDISKQMVIRHVVPYMFRAKAGIARHLLFDREKIAKSLAECLHCIEQCQCEADDLDGREATLREAISLLRDNLGPEAVKHKIYGTCLNNMGHTLLQRRRFDEAAKVFIEAIAAEEKAEDYDSAAEKQAYIQKSQAGLVAANNKQGVCLVQ